MPPKLRTQLYRSELQLEELRSQAQHARGELSTLEAEYAAALARREALERQSTQTTQDVQRVDQERATLAESVAGLDDRIAPLTAELDTAREGELAAHAALAQARAKLDTVLTRLREVEMAATELAERKAEQRVRGESMRAEADRLEREERAARERAEQAEIAAGGAAHRYGERRRRLESLDEELLEARGRSEDAERDASSAQEAVAHAVAAHRDLSGEVAAAQSRLHTIEELENSLEGHVPGTRAVVEAWQKNELRGIEGIVSNLIATDERYARAMDVAFGARLSNVVTTTSEDAERAVAFLNRLQAGRATFLPLDTLSDRTGRKIDAELAGCLRRHRIRAHADSHRCAIFGHRQFLGRKRSDRHDAGDGNRPGPLARPARHHRYAQRRADYGRRRDYRRPLPTRSLDSIATFCRTEPARSPGGAACQTGRCRARIARRAR